MRPDADKPLKAALAHMRAALGILDSFPGPIGAAEHLDLAAQRLAEALGEPLNMHDPQSGVPSFLEH